MEIWTPFYYLRGGTLLTDALRRVKLQKPVNAVAFLLAVPRVTWRARRCSVVHLQGGQLPPLYLMLVLSLRAAGPPIVHTVHNTFDRGASWRSVRKLIGRCASRVIVHARSDLQAIDAELRARTRVIPHGEYAGLARRAGGDVDQAAARAGLGLPEEAIVALVFGQMRADKGIDDLLLAARDVGDLHVLVAGEDRGVLATLDGLRAPLTGRVHVFEGFHDSQAMARFFSAADVVVTPYPRASQSGVLLLAYAFSRPVVAYPVGGLVEAIEPGRTGWLTERADVAALAKTLSEVVAGGATECRRRGEEGGRLAARRFGWKDIARETIAVYTEALD
jgi:glycosyltransferase involved in cell wall biosynthesis